VYPVVVRKSSIGSVASIKVCSSFSRTTWYPQLTDSELDVDLLSEQELYDPNTIGSMLKTWLRELPTEIFPQELQSALAADLQRDNPSFNMMGQSAPQKLRDALSELPPFNYYLLFAITCHLSLLLSHQERNRMDLNNLSICIGPCLNLERWLFNYLVGDWRNCWQGCWTEKQQLDEEKRITDPYYMPPPTSSGGNTLHSSSSRGFREAMGSLDLEDRAVSSGGESGSSGRNNSLHAETSTQHGNDSRMVQTQQPPRNMGASRNTRPSAENVRDANSGNRHREVQKPNTYAPAVFHQPQPPPQSYGGNGTVNGTGHRAAHILMQQQDQRRPTTSDSRSSNSGLPREGSVPALPSTTRPNRLHHRSQSDLPLSPSQTGFSEQQR
jgi:hypothetical protein